MSGNAIDGCILIDKFQCYLLISPEEQQEATALKEHIEKILSKHYNPNAFKVTISKQYHRLSFWFTPTRYFRTAEDFKKYTDINLTMPLEEELFNLFVELLDSEFFLKSINTCKITKLDLTKNFIMEEPIQNYINMLEKRIYKGTFRTIFISSKKHEKTLSITSLAHNSKSSDKVGDRELIIYDKVKELHKRKIKKVFLKSSLSQEEEKQISKWSYNKNIDELDLRFINLLRMELQYGSSNKLSALSKNFGFDDYKKGLYLKDFFMLLQEGILYKKLDEYYTNTVLDILGYLPQKAIEKLNIYQQIIKEYFNNVINLEINSVLRHNNLLKRHRENLLKIQAQVNNTLFDELCEKIRQHSFNGID